MFVKLPGQREGKVDDRNAETIDLLPTVADALDAELAAAVDGRSLLDPSLPEPPIKRIGDQGNEIEVDAAFAPDLASLRRKYQLFPRRRGEWQLYGLGPYADLVGTPLSELELLSEPGLGAVLDPASQVIELEASYTNALLIGEVADDPSQDGAEVHLAIAVNGFVAGLSVASPSDGHGWFSVMVPETLLHEGPNPAELFLVEGDPGSPRLRPPLPLNR